MNRRTFLLTAVTLPLAATLATAAHASARALVHTDPSCSCCGSWVTHMRQAGFAVEVRQTADIAFEKARLGVPEDLFSCHTAEIDGYVVEGHVPADAVRRLLAERPQAIGLSVPGMPIGSPGMEVAGMEPDVFDVILFGPAGSRTYASYRGGLRLPL
jgi:hypothetical protein